MSKDDSPTWLSTLMEGSFVYVSQCVLGEDVIELHQVRRITKTQVVLDDYRFNVKTQEPVGSKGLWHTPTIHPATDPVLEKAYKRQSSVRKVNSYLKKLGGALATLSPEHLETARVNLSALVGKLGLDS